MAGGKGDTFGADLMKLALNATPIANMADNAASAPLGNLYASLHSADPGHGGDQTTSELSYTGYARVAVARNNGSPGWTVTNPGTGAQALNAGTIAWPACTAGSGTAAWVAIGTAVSGTGKILYRGQVSSPSGGLAISNGITPQAGASAVVLTES